MADLPQAFPHGDPTNGGDIGMTLRDWFAGQAIAGVITATAAGQHHPSKFQGETTIVQAMAWDAYNFADAMLAQREAGQ